MRFPLCTSSDLTLFDSLQWNRKMNHQIHGLKGDTGQPKEGTGLPRSWDMCSVETQSRTCMLKHPRKHEFVLPHPYFWFFEPSYFLQNLKHFTSKSCPHSQSVWLEQVPTLQHWEIFVSHRGFRQVVVGSWMSWQSRYLHHIRILSSIDRNSALCNDLWLWHAKHSFLMFLMTESWGTPANKARAISPGLVLPAWFLSEHPKFHVLPLLTSIEKCVNI